jgi:hypothetical protein
VLGAFRKSYELTGKIPSLVVEVVPKSDAVDKAAIARTATNTCKSLASDGFACGALIDISTLAVAQAASKGLSLCLSLSLSLYHICWMLCCLIHSLCLRSFFLFNKLHSNDYACFLPPTCIIHSPPPHDIYITTTTTLIAQHHHSPIPPLVTLNTHVT